MRGSAPVPDIQEIVLTARETRRPDRVIRRLVSEDGATDDLGLLTRLAGHRDLLPVRLLDALAGVRPRRGSPVTVVRRPRPDEDVGPTPRHWRLRGRTATAAHDLWLALVSLQVGEPVCWQTLQDGRLFNDVLPIKGQEHAQTGHSSAATLDYHVEDAFDDDRCDVLALLCLRNRDLTATTVATAGGLHVGTADHELLRRPRFAILPDPEHLKANGTADVSPAWRPVLFGDAQPCLRIDPPFTRTAPGDDASAQAFARLCRQLEGGLVHVRLHPGDLVLIDNYRAVHGREPFTPRYDGTDRWLRKLTLTFDLRRSSGRRRAGSRALSLS
ncbi:TauD/TfdA family dioxygenase [Streptomyces paromomycinus]|uniref:L-asparagine oxygenase n=1 Tax=Streptomyces paromomycinus TaxID=92743 RepID=A0A401VV24_STREY|nr:TauD/TfdA family dioxygenase [Streptomyces paromomycinus]GCD40891.1 L-asparagine oxygenase [Streptomyces paromomycinus]